MRFLAILLFAPWLLILGWAYWAYPKAMVRTAARRLFDIAALLLATMAAVQGALLGFDRAVLPAVGQFGRGPGAIWQQVLPALCGYGAFSVVLVLALVARQLGWGRHR
jgi:hypothetical protein